LSKIDFKSIVEQARAGQFKPVYFFHGDETFLTRQAVAVLLEHAVDKATADFNFDRFHGADLNVERLLTVLNTPPMMAPRRVVLVRDLEKTSLPGKQMLADYAEKPMKSTVLILAAGERIRIDARKKTPKWAAKLESAAASALFWPLREPELIRWIMAQAELKGKKISSTAAYELYARLGGSLERLAGELEKLSVFCADREEITREDISSMSGVQAGGTVFDWVEALAAGNTLRSCRLANYLITHGESAVSAISLAAAHFLTLTRVKQLLAAGMLERDIKFKLGLSQRPAEAVRNIFTQARSYSVSRLERALELLLEADSKIKKSSLPDKLILEELSFRFRSEVAG